MGQDAHNDGGKAVQTSDAMQVALTAETPVAAGMEVIQESIERVLSSEGSRDVEVSVLLTDDARIQELNETYRNQTNPTDVLSFSQVEDRLDAPDIAAAANPCALLGDIVISVDTAARQASQRGVSLEEELAELAAHGALHLLGYEDETDEGLAAMQRRAAEALEPMRPRFSRHAA